MNQVLSKHLINHGNIDEIKNYGIWFVPHVNFIKDVGPFVLKSAYEPN